MRKTRIVEITDPDGTKEYQIQVKHWLLWFLWVDASYSPHEYCYISANFASLTEAKGNIYRFDGSKPTTKVVQ